MSGVLVVVRIIFFFNRKIAQWNLENNQIILHGRRKIQTIASGQVLIVISLLTYAEKVNHYNRTYTQLSSD